MIERTLFEMDMHQLRMAVERILEGAYWATDEERREIGQLAELLGDEAKREGAPSGSI